MKTKKINLQTLQVESFITSIKAKQAETVRGGNVVIKLATALLSYTSHC